MTLTLEIGNIFFQGLDEEIIGHPLTIKVNHLQEVLAHCEITATLLNQCSRSHERKSECLHNNRVKFVWMQNHVP